MGFLKLFTKPSPTLLALPAGSYTVDRGGEVLASTLPSSFPPELATAIAQGVREAFRGAAEAQLPLTELVIHYPTLKIKARELRGGAIIFFFPKTPYAPSKTS